MYHPKSLTTGAGDRTAAGQFLIGLWIAIARQLTTAVARVIVFISAPRTLRTWIPLPSKASLLSYAWLVWPLSLIYRCQPKISQMVQNPSSPRISKYSDSRRQSAAPRAWLVTLQRQPTKWPAERTCTHQPPALSTLVVQVDVQRCAVTRRTEISIGCPHTYF